MPDGVMPLVPVIVTMPGEIDVTNAGDAEAQITAALAPGVTVIIADLTKTSFCDSCGLQHLLRAGEKAAGSGAQLRLAISPTGRSPGSWNRPASGAVSRPIPRSSRPPATSRHPASRPRPARHVWARPWRTGGA
jgi:hypothetical protein